mmetsp:Transcript_19637/g.40728  ORF Transcript_19637/g.40728 Transcript_19637/m.40728 type:complete len:90 (-) Transcript_19637:235-504(-)
MSRIGSCNFREKEKSFNTQEETWRQTCEKERFIEVLAPPPQTTFHDVAHSSGPTRSTAHTTHIGQNAQAAAAERPAGKPSAIGLHWGIQ